MLNQFSKMKSLKTSTNYQTILKKLSIVSITYQLTSTIFYVENYWYNQTPFDSEIKDRTKDMSYYFNGVYRPILSKYIEQVITNFKAKMSSFDIY